MYNPQNVKEKIRGKMIGWAILAAGLFLSTKSLVSLPALSLSFTVPLIMLGVIMDCIAKT